MYLVHNINSTILGVGERLVLIRHIFFTLI
uniref:Uncharacterized protein n=1 Tax=Rhizophora mucronata TaxID=61149 RepID=A0A2P2Q7Y3_RHIMU